MREFASVRGEEIAELSKQGGFFSRMRDAFNGARVSLALFLVDALPAADTFVLDGPEGHHAADVQRMRVGERLMLGDGAGATATAEVTAVAQRQPDTVHCRPAVRAGRRSPRLVVAQGLPKGDRGELAVQAMTEVGVDEIVPWQASRCVTVWRDNRGAKAREKWVATAREAAKQARRAWIPAIGAGRGDHGDARCPARCGDVRAARGRVHAVECG